MAKVKYDRHDNKFFQNCKTNIKDWNLELKYLWVEFGHPEDIKQVQNWRSWK